MSVQATADALAKLPLEEARTRFSEIVDQAKFGNTKERLHFNALLATELRKNGVRLWNDGDTTSFFEAA